MRAPSILPGQAQRSAAPPGITGMLTLVSVQLATAAREQTQLVPFAPVRGLRGLAQIPPLNAACSRSFGLSRSCGLKCLPCSCWGPNGKMHFGGSMARLTNRSS